MTRYWANFILLASVSVFHPLVCVSQQQPDITGVTLGMSEQAAEAKLGPSYGWRTMLTWPKTTVTVRVGTKGDEAYALQSVDGKIVYIYHHVKFAPGAAPELRSLTAQLQQKYGPMLVNPQRDPRLDLGAGYKHWMFDNSGKSLVSRPTGMNCPISANGSSGTSTPNVPTGTKYIPLDQPVPPNCPTFMEAFVTAADPNHELAATLTIDLGNEVPIYNEVVRINKAAQQQHDSQVKSAQGVKAPL